MLTFTEAQVLAWISPVLWPFLRVLALFGAMPVIGQRGVPVRLRVALAFLIAVCAQASLPAMPAAALDSAAALSLLVQQLLVGLTLAFAARIVFAAIEFAGRRSRWRWSACSPTSNRADRRTSERAYFTPRRTPSTR